ncbi:MAG: flagellar hook-basal body protein [Myxococcota bacterium]
MSSGIYVSYTGATSNLRRLETVANNIANASTAGYLRDRTGFDTVLGAALPFAESQASSVDLRPGTPKLTGSPLHAAIDGDGFFVVENAQGDELYTRRGDFRLNSQGQLVLPNGMTVVGEGGALVVPPDGVPTLSPEGTLRTQDGVLGKLRIVRFEDPSGLQKRGQSLLAASSASPAVAVVDPKLDVGFVASSNVNLAAEMVAMIQTSRAFEASMQSLRLDDQLTQRLIQSSQ